MRTNTQLIKQTLIVLVFIITLFISSQVFALSGKVVDTDRNPIIGATVATNISMLGTITKNDGSFELSDNSDITYITVSSVGFKSVNYTIAEIPQEIQLENVYYQAGDILVTAFASSSVLRYLGCSASMVCRPPIPDPI